MTSQARGIRSIEVGGRLLKALVVHAVPMTLKDLAAAAEMAPAQAHAYLVSFRRVGLVEQDQATGRYQMGPFGMRLAIARLNAVPLIAAATRATTELAHDTGIMTTLSVWGPHGPTVVHKQEGNEALNVNIRAGTMFSLTRTATGHVFAAFAPAERISAKFDAELATAEANGGETLSREAFAKLIASVRSAGYATTAEAPVPAVNAAAAPVFDPSGDLAAVMTLIGSSTRLPVNDARHPVLQMLIRAASDLRNTRGPGEPYTEGARPRAAALKARGAQAR